MVDYTNIHNTRTSENNNPICTWSLELSWYPISSYSEVPLVTLVVFVVSVFGVVVVISAELVKVCSVVPLDEELPSV